MNLTLLGSFLLAIAVLGVLFLYFEKGKPPALPILLMSATLAAVASIGRVIFNFIPQVQPVTAIVIIAGFALGPQSGFLVGALSAFASNLVLGQGPWTPWQMLAWGCIGLFSSLLGKVLPKLPLWIICGWGFLCGLLYSLMIDVYTVASIGEQLTLPMAMATFGAGLLFNISHAVGNVIFLILLYKPMVKKLERIQGKYQLGLSQTRC